MMDMSASRLEAFTAPSLGCLGVVAISGVGALQHRDTFTSGWS
jgi:hypothetical protein